MDTQEIIGKHEKKLSYNFLTDKEDDIFIEEDTIDYDSLVYLDKKDFSNADFDTNEVAFYCKNCKKQVDICDPNENTKSNKLHCEICGTSNIIIGTARGIKEHYHL